jgi:hypothetical protein
MEETVYLRSGLLGLAVLMFVNTFPRFVDRVTGWIVKHSENEDRAEDKLQDAFIEELRSSRAERLTVGTNVGNLMVEMQAFRRSVDTFAIEVMGFRAAVDGLSKDLKAFMDSQRGNK